MRERVPVRPPPLASRPGRGTVRVMESGLMRREALLTMLRPWAKAEGLEIRPWTLGEDDDADAGTDPACRLALLSIGSRTAASRVVVEWLVAARARFPDAPFVLFSDRNDARGISRAFELGVRGYVPATLEPALVLSALTLVLNGGSYVPPVAFRV